MTDVKMSGLHDSIFIREVVKNTILEQDPPNHKIVGAGLEKKPVRSSGTSRFPLRRSNFLSFLARRASHGQGPRQVIRRLNFW